MNKQIILTKGDYGIELQIQFLDDRRQPIDITGQTVDVCFVSPTFDKKFFQAYLIEPKQGKCGIIITEEMTNEEGLYSTYWRVLDEDELVTAQDNLYYFVLPKFGGV